VKRSFFSCPQNISVVETVTNITHQFLTTIKEVRTFNIQQEEVLKAETLNGM